MDLYDELQWREMLYDSTDGVRDALAAGRVTGYIGFDPTAASLHVGSLLTILGLARLQRSGHAAIAVVGGGTGMIGDPSGKSQERVLLSREQIDANVAGIRAQLARFLDFDDPHNPARIVNNADWLANHRRAVVPARRGEALHHQRHAAEGVGEPAAGDAKKGFPTRSSATWCCRRTIFCSCSTATAARCRWAGAISGATSPRASI